MSDSILRLDWASYQSAKYACINWHYSKSIPVPPMVRVGVWEAGQFIGVVIFSRGASPKLVAAYGLKQTEGVELSRIALREHVTPVSRIIRIAVKLLVNRSPGIQLIVSYADVEQNHHGGIYQAGNWVFVGQTPAGRQYLFNGRKLHTRQVSKSGERIQFGKVVKVLKHEQLTLKRTRGKYKYLLPLNSKIRESVIKLSKDYPKR